MDFTKFLTVVAILAVVLSAVNVVRVADLRSAGYASSREYGNVTFEIESRILITFTNNLVNWSTGYVDTDGTPTECGPGVEAQLATNTTNGSSGNLLASNPSGSKCGISWIPRLQGLTLRSDSNQDIVVTLNSDQNALNLIDGGVTIPTNKSEFQWMVQNNATGTTCEGRMYPLNYTDIVAGTNVTICNDMDWADGVSDTLDIDFLVNISSYATVLGERRAVITATAERNSTSP